jgi:outer membrane autotransporter protein
VLVCQAIPSTGYAQTLNEVVNNQLEIGQVFGIECEQLLDGDPFQVAALTGRLFTICTRGFPAPGAGPSISTGGGAATPVSLPSIVQQRLREARGEEKKTETKPKAGGASADRIARLGNGLSLFVSGEFESLNRDATTLRSNPSSRMALMGPEPYSWELLRPQGVMVVSPDPTTGVPPPAEIVRGPIRLTGIVIQEATPNSAIIRIQADQPVARYSTFLLDNPPRLVIDIAGALLAEPVLRKTAGKGAIKQIRSSQYRREPEPVVRVVLDLISTLPYQVVGIPDTYQILIGEAVAKARKVEPPEPPTVIAEAPRFAPGEVAKAPEAPEPFWRRVSPWGSGEFESLDKEVTTFEDGYDSNIWRVTAGADYRFTDRIVAGLAFDAYWQKGDFNSGGGFNINSYGFLAYGSFVPLDKTYLQLSAGYARKTYNRDRIATFTQLDADGNVDFSTVPFGTVVNADHNAGEVRVSALAGYDYPIGNVTISPRAGFDFYHLNFGTYSETGSTGLELTFHDDAQTSLQTRLGVQALASFSTGFGLVVPQASFDWIHEFENDQRNVQVSFVDDTRAKRFTYQTEPPDRDWLEINAGVVVVLPNGLQVFGNYRTIVGNSIFDSQAGTIGLRVAF